MERIVLGFDGRRPSLVALAWVAEPAARAPLRIEIVMIAGAVESDDFRVDESLARAERSLRDHAPAADVSVLRCAGSMPHALVDCGHTADLCVIGAHKGRLPRTLASRDMPMLADTPIPLCLVPQIDAD